MHARAPLLALAVVMTSCGNSADTPVTELPVDHQGMWITDCLGGFAGKNAGAVLSRVLEGGQLVAEARVYGTRWCDPGTDVFAATLLGTYEVGGRVIGNLDDAHQLDITVTDAHLLLLSQSELESIEASLTPPGAAAPLLQLALDQPATMRSRVGESCVSAADCVFSECDTAAGRCVPCADAAACYADVFADLLRTHELPEVAAGDALYDIVWRSGDAFRVGDVPGNWTYDVADRPIALDDARFHAADPRTEGTWPTSFAEDVRGTWKMDGEDRFVVGATSVEVKNNPLSFLNGTYALYTDAGLTPAGIYNMVGPDRSLYHIYLVKRPEGYFSHTLPGIYATTPLEIYENVAAGPFTK